MVLQGRQRRRGAHRVVAATLVASLAMAGCGQSVSVERSAGGYVQGDYGITLLPVDERPAAPELAGEALSGERLSLSDFAGKTVLVNVWGSWCVPCREEVADLKAARRQLPGDSVAFVGINIRDDRSAAVAFERRNGIGWPSWYDPDSSLLLGFRDSLAAAAVPTTYIVDSDGNIAVRMLDKQTAKTFVDLVTDVQAGGGGAGGG